MQFSGAPATEPAPSEGHEPGASAEEVAEPSQENQQPAAAPGDEANKVAAVKQMAKAKLEDAKKIINALKKKV